MVVLKLREQQCQHQAHCHCSQDVAARKACEESLYAGRLSPTVFDREGADGGKCGLVEGFDAVVRCVDLSGCLAEDEDPVQSRVGNCKTGAS